MSRFPRGRGAFTALLFCLQLVFLTGCRSDPLVGYQPQVGDIVFQSLEHNDLVDAIEGITHSPWSHCGLVIERDGKWYVAEALGKVHDTQLQTWVQRSRGNTFAIYRVKNLSAEQAAKLAKAARPFRGKPYDFRYAPDDREIYCSELVYKIYDRALGLKLGDWQKLGELDWKPFESFIRHMEGGDLPLDRPMITPVALTRSPHLEMIQGHMPKK